MNFSGKKILIMGLGLHGGGAEAAKYFYSKGADVLVTDLKKEKELNLSLLENFPVKYVLGRHRKKDFKEADLVIKNPAVPWSSEYLKLAKGKVKSDVMIFFELCPREQIIGITGTKGKSTTAFLTYLLLKEKYPALLAGNIGISPFKILDKITKETKVVLELSSFGLEGLQKSPKTALITNILPDHLDRYKNMEEYIEAKKNIFRYQEKEDILILNYDNLRTRMFSKEAKGKVCFFSEKDFSGAITVAKTMKVPSEKIKKVLKDFKGLPGRQELVREKEGVRYYNDTTATMPEAVIKALKSFNNIILISGGVDKGLKYNSLSKEIQKKVKFLILLPGSASELIAKRVSKKKTFFVSSMKEAVKKSASLSVKGDNVILSPGAASFNLFKNEFDRGDIFKEEVKKI